MEPSQTKSGNKEFQNRHEERIQKIDSEIKSKKQQLLEELENSQDDNSRRRRHPKFSQPQTETLKLPSEKKQHLEFAPFQLKTLEFKRKAALAGGEIFYNEKHNLIMVCPHGDSLFYLFDATTFSALEEIEGLKPDKAMFDVSFWPETDTLLFASSEGDLYAYDFGKKNSQETLENGKIRIYRTDRLPKLPVLCSAHAHRNSSVFVNKEKVVIQGKEFILTRGRDGTIKVWHLVKGKMRLLRVIKTGEYVEGSCTYLETYRMICTTKGKESIKFFSLISGELKNTFYLNPTQFVSVLFMKGKNALGVADWNRKVVEIIQLHPKQEKSDFMMEV